MKHREFPFALGLPDAPLAMPKQDLEPARSLLDVLRSVLGWARP